MDVVRFYFSFRSPFAWLAYHLAPRALRELPVELQPIPVFPPPDFPNDPAAVPAKLEYISQHDMPRIAEAYGFKLAPLAQFDVDWMPPPCNVALRVRPRRGRAVLGSGPDPVAGALDRARARSRRTVPGAVRVGYGASTAASERSRSETAAPS